MLKVGLTGNIGSGKTMVSKIFQTLGVPVFHADMEARKLYDLFEVKNAVRDYFGGSVISSEGEVLRKELAAVVFDNPAKLKILNRIIHPLVRKNYLDWCYLNACHSYTLYEAAILFESGHYMEMDKIICVTAPVDLRIKRVTERDKINAKEVIQRMKNQWNDDKKVSLADYVIVNDENEHIIPQIINIHRQITDSIVNTPT